jgi:DNA repair protein SbcD/Mre11
LRVLHTSDWHLGRLFHGTSLLDDQSHALEQVVRLAGDAKVDALIVAGDIFDRQVPPAEAVNLLDETLSKVALDLRIPVLVIAGNHDSPDRLGFGSRILEGGKVHVAGGLGKEIRKVQLRDKHGPVDIFLVPYAEPAMARGIFEAPKIVDHQTLLAAVIGRVRPGPRSMLVAHAFVRGGVESPDSERPLLVGGAGTIDASLFRGFSYVALGHLHRPQAVEVDTLRYSGSLLKYSFDETAHRKSVTLVDMNADGRCTFKEVEIKPRRDVRRVEGTLEEVLKLGESDPAREDYMQVSLKGRDALFDAMGQIRRVYPNTMDLRKPDLEQGGELIGERLRLDRVTEAELFASFFAQVVGSPMSSDEEAALRSVLEVMRQEEVTA